MHTPISGGYGWSGIKGRVALCSKVIGNEMVTIALGVFAFTVFNDEIGDRGYQMALDYYLMYIGIIGFVSSIAVIVRYGKKGILPRMKSIFFMPLVLVLALIRFCGMFVVICVGLYDEDGGNNDNLVSAIMLMFGYRLFFGLSFKFRLYSKDNGLIVSKKKVDLTIKETNGESKGEIEQLSDDDRIEDRERFECNIYKKENHYIVAAGIISIIFAIILVNLLNLCGCSVGIRILGNGGLVGDIVSLVFMSLFMLIVSILEEVEEVIISKTAYASEPIHLIGRSKEKKPEQLSKRIRKEIERSEHKVFRHASDTLLDGYFVRYFCTFSAGIIFRRIITDGTGASGLIPLMVPFESDDEDSGATTGFMSYIQIIIQGIDIIFRSFREIRDDRLSSLINGGSSSNLGRTERYISPNDLRPAGNYQKYSFYRVFIKYFTGNFGNQFDDPGPSNIPEIDYTIMYDSYCFIFMVIFGVIGMILECFYYRSEHMRNDRKKNKNKDKEVNIFKNKDKFIFSTKAKYNNYNIVSDVITNITGPIFGCGIAVINAIFGSYSINNYYILLYPCASYLCNIICVMSLFFWSKNVVRKDIKEFFVKANYKRFTNIKNTSSKNKSKNSEDYEKRSVDLSYSSEKMRSSSDSVSNNYSYSNNDKKGLSELNGSTSDLPKSRILGDYENINMFPKSEVESERNNSKIDNIQLDDLTSSATPSIMSDVSSHGIVLSTDNVEISPTMSAGQYGSRNENGIMLDQPPGVTFGDGLSFLDI